MENDFREKLLNGKCNYSYAVVYARYSCDRQNEQSIDGQLRVCQDYAERNGIKIVKTYIDKAMTGTNDNREAFQRMLKDSTKRNGNTFSFISSIGSPATNTKWRFTANTLKTTVSRYYPPWKISPIRPRERFWRAYWKA